MNYCVSCITLWVMEAQGFKKEAECLKNKTQHFWFQSFDKRVCSVT